MVFLPMLGAVIFIFFGMKKIKMHQQLLTFEEGCNLYLLNCKKRNLRQGTINHYKQSYTQFYKYFDMEMLLTDFTKEAYEEYEMHLQEAI